MNTSKNFSFGKKNELLPQEEKLEIGKQQKSLTIGVPKDSCEDESRVPLTPLAVNLLVNNGHQVIMESDAGKSANFSDKDYSESGGQIVYSKEEIFKSDVVIKISPFSEEEIDMLPGKQTIISNLHVNTQSKEVIRKMMQKRLTAFAFEYLQDKKGNLPIVQLMSEISGSTSILIASEYLSNVHEGKGEMLGGITSVTPTEVVIIGADTAAEYAARTALGLGALVKVFDNSIEKLRELKRNVGETVYTSVTLSKVLSNSLKSADVVIGALHLANKGPVCVVTEEMVRQMKKGSVIIDLSIEYGGCFETSQLTSQTNPVYQKHNVVHYCVPNVPSRVARTASYAISNVLTPTLLDVGSYGGAKALVHQDVGFRYGAYIFNGILVNEYVGKTFDIPSKDIDLLLAAF